MSDFEARPFELTAKDTEGKVKGVEIGDGKTKPEVTKTADKSTANVGDKVTYTIKLANGEFASAAIKFFLFCRRLAVSISRISVFRLFAAATAS